MLPEPMEHGPDRLRKRPTERERLLARIVERTPVGSAVSMSLFGEEHGVAEVVDAVSRDGVRRLVARSEHNRMDVESVRGYMTVFWAVDGGERSPIAVGEDFIESSEAGVAALRIEAPDGSALWPPG